MSKKKNDTKPENPDQTPEEQRPLFSIIEDFFYQRCTGDGNEIKANLSILDWIFYLVILFVIIRIPFLYSASTTENFLTPKEFLSKELLALVAGGYVLKIIEYYLNKKPLRLTKTKLDFPLTLFLGFAALSVLWNYNPSSAIRDFRGILCIFLLFPLVVNIVRSRWQVEIILWLVIIAALATSALGIMETYNWYFKITESGIHYVKDEVLSKQIDPKAFYLPRFPQLATPDHAMASVVSTFGNRNYLGTFAMFAVFLPLAFFFYYRNIFLKFLSLILYAQILAGLYISRCRAALIGVILGMIYMFFMILLFDRKKIMIRRNLLFLFFSVLLILSVLFYVSVSSLQKVGSQSIYDKIKDTFTLNRLVSNTYERLWVWHATNATFNHSIKTWLIGTGLGSFKHIFPRQQAMVFSDNNKETFTSVTFRQAHNDWLQLLSELGIIGVLLFLFLLHRFFSQIIRLLRHEIYYSQNGIIKGDHILIIGMTSAFVAQFLASIPDFPFHRIETALYAVLFLSLTSVLLETKLFVNHAASVEFDMGPSLNAACALLIFVSSLLTYYYENRTWKADELVRSAETALHYVNQRPEALDRARMMLLEAIELDPLPGDPYLKLASIYEMKNEPVMALNYAKKSVANINFNARSTYHSVAYRKMQIHYRLNNDLIAAYEKALEGLNLTCGPAKILYYYFAGELAYKISKLPISNEHTESMLANANDFLLKAAASDDFKAQSLSYLAMIEAENDRWQTALNYSTSVLDLTQINQDIMQNIAGIALYNLQRYPEAEAYLLQALNNSPQNGNYMRDLAMVYIGQSRFLEARSLLNRVLRSPSLPQDAKQQLATTLASLAQHDMQQVASLIEAAKYEEAKEMLNQMKSSNDYPKELQDWAEQSLTNLASYQALEQSAE